jgi:hypothetical protein
MNEFLHHYAEIMSDPAHFFAEVSNTIIIDVLFLGLIWPVIKRLVDRRIRREHLRIDAEHGVDHDEQSQRLYEDSLPPGAPLWTADVEPDDPSLVLSWRAGA